MAKLTLPVRLPANDGALYVLNTRAVKKRQRQLHIHGSGKMAHSEVMDWGAPPTKPRIEVYDHGRKVWVRPDRDLQRKLNRLTGEQLQQVLRNMRFGLRLAPEFEDDPDLDAKLDKALGCGLLTLGGRSYKLAQSPSGNVRVTGAFGVKAFTRDALLDVIQRGQF